MRSIGLKTLLGAAALSLAATGAQAGSIAANPKPITFDAGFGDVTVSGQVSGLAFYQSNATHLAPGDGQTEFDIDNALITVQKSDGMFQFYIQAGLYSFPTVGNPYDKANDTNSFLGPVPVAYAKLQLSDNFSIEAGKLPTLVGAELAFTPQNINIERGLLWWQEPVSSRGVQVNYSAGPLSIALSWNDGYYSDIWNSGSALISYTIDDSNTIAFDASITPDVGNRLFESRRPGTQIYDLMYTFSSDPWTIAPYVQYQNFNDHPSYSCGGCKLSSGSNWGIGILASYQIDPNWSLNGRFEYEGASGGSPNFWGLEYGQKSKAWSLTVTPTYQDGMFFARGEVSYTGLSDQTFGFGSALNKDSQFRALFETGIVF